MKHLISILTITVFIFSNTLANAQSEFKKTDFKILKKTTNDPKEIETDYNPTLYNLESPIPTGNSAKNYLLQQKIASREYFKHLPKSPEKSVQKSTEGPIIGSTFEPKRYTSTGNQLPITGGLPSDNTMAVSNDGIVMVAMNSVLYARNMVTDTAVFPNYQISLRTFVSGVTSSSYYDPKLIYDPVSDRFILALLKDTDTLKNEIIICFSSTNNPNDPWNIYHLPGNPLLNGRWTDFPCITVTADKLYFTANLIIPDVSWQVGFDGSIIWEMDKLAGYTGAIDINATLYSDIKYGGQFIRNLHPVQAADGTSEQLTLLSNRNFAIQNDTIFYLQLIDNALQIQVLKTDISYGVPPNARQFDTDLSIPSDGLQTNDARVLGSVQFEDEIHFVGNTINPETGFSAIYHGIINNLDSTPTVKGSIIGDSIKDFGYPNISSSGNELCDREVIIGFNFTSFTDFPGVAAVHFNNAKIHSSLKTLKAGYNYVNRLTGGYERWGDYFGMQAKYNEPGTAYAFGFLALVDKTNSGFCAQLRSPDPSVMKLDITTNTPLKVCNNTVSVAIENGTQPYEYFWNMNPSTTINELSNLCSGDSLTIKVIDSNGCTSTTNYTVPFSNLASGIYSYPNPASDLVTTQFSLDSDGPIKAELYDEQGKLINLLLETTAKKGLNEFSFSVELLANGIYSVILISDTKIIEKFRFVKK